MVEPTIDSKAFTKAIRVFVDHSVRESLRREPELYADAILPVLLPSLRRAFATFMGDLVATLQKLLERGLSVESLKWRFEAFRTDRPFAEIVLLHSLIYRVEQVLLIDHQSGLLLDHVEIPQAHLADPDLMSGMLTAVTDFIRDSFQIQYTTGSGTLQYGNQLLWTQRGKQVTLAALITGQPPHEFRETLHDAVLQLEALRPPLITQSEGQVRLTRSAAEYLMPCLTSAYGTRSSKDSLFWRHIAIGIVAVLILFPILLTVAQFRSKLLLAHYQTVLEHVPGVVITHTERKKGHFYFYGFQDSFAPSPVTALSDAHLDPKRAVLKFESFVSDDLVVFERRLRKFLPFPKTAEFAIGGGRLYLRGSVPYPWFQKNRTKLELISLWIPFEMSDLNVEGYGRVGDRNAS